mgnify:FL=1
MHGRGVNGSNGYRYGFNGKEDDTEIKGEGNSYDFGSRIYDPRVARFLSLDPRSREFSGLSPYAYAANDPIGFIDEEGEGPFPSILGPSMRTAALTLNTYTRIAVKAFQAVFVHPLPKSFISHYAYSNGTPYKLSSAQMKDIHPTRVGVQGMTKSDHKNFETKLAAIKNGETVDFSTSVTTGANTAGTLGRFQANFEGKLTKSDDGKSWSFEGKMSFSDIYDFKTTPSEPGDIPRTDWGNTQTEIADKTLPGKGFEVTSEKVDVKQSSSEFSVDWFKNVSDKTVLNKVSESPEMKNKVTKEQKETN